MRKGVKTSIGGIALLSAAIGSIVFATGRVSGSDDDTEEPITGEALAKATAAALAYTGSGRVTETEVGDEDSYYEVEVTLDDGRQIDVQLDEDFQVVSAESDDEEEDDGED